MESLREKIVRLSQQLAESTDEKEIKILKKRIAELKQMMTPTEPKQIGGFFKEKKQ